MENKYGKRPVWQWVGIYAVIAVMLYGIIYYVAIAKKGGYGSSVMNQNPQATANLANAQQFTVTGNEFSFDPAVITVKKGAPVQIIFNNSGKYPHNLTISDLNIGTKTIQPGQQDSFTFTPTTARQYTFTCTVPGHADKGMTGTLNVQ